MKTNKLETHEVLDDLLKSRFVKGFFIWPKEMKCMEAQEIKKEPMSDMPFEHGLVYSLLREGIGNCTTSRDIERITHLSGTRVRQIMSELVIKYGHIVGAVNGVGKQGYFIPTNQDEERTAILNLRSRRLKVEKRERALINNIANKYQQQLDI